jgi:prophage tail gpP-like protein
MSFWSDLSNLVGGTLPEQDTNVSLWLSGVKWQGWQDVRITRGCERCPADFELRVTEKYADATQIAVTPGQECTLAIGDTLVIDGYIDFYSGNLSTGTHEIRIAGRSRCQDLVDSHAVVTNGQLGNCDIVQLATQLAKPYGIDVVLRGVELPTADADRIIQYFNITLGQTPFDLIETCARYMGLLVYDDADGNLVLASVGESTQSNGTVSLRKHASGFSEGVNVQHADVTFRMDSRMSAYLPVMFSTLQFNDYDNPNQGNQFPPVPDPGVPRYRPYFVVSEQSYNSVFLAQLRAKWELQRRRGRSQAVRLVCDSWYDKAGKLWTPNMLASVNLPTLKLPARTWLITEVTFFTSPETGTGAQITLMPPESMTIEPAVQTPFDWQVEEALKQAGQSPGTPSP